MEDKMKQTPKTQTKEALYDLTQDLSYVFNLLSMANDCLLSNLTNRKNFNEIINSLLATLHFSTIKLNRTRQKLSEAADKL
jgi:hypothetical protein